MITHISFDVWNTLIKPNPEFALARTKLIALALNLDEAYVKTAYTHVKRVVDGMAEREGKAYSTEEVYKLLFSSMCVSVSPALAKEIRLSVDELFRCLPPTIGHGVREMLDWLTRSRITASIGSNSNYISGSVMLPWIESACSHQFAFSLFSDLELTAKPSKEFFELLYDHVNDDRYPETSHFPVQDPKQILHVGDNEICDVFGAQRCGMHGLLIVNPDTVAEQVKLRIGGGERLQPVVLHQLINN
jgi:putative hydrolase of the HAD superfamily